MIEFSVANNTLIIYIYKNDNLIILNQMHFTIISLLIIFKNKTEFLFKSMRSLVKKAGKSHGKIKGTLVDKWARLDYLSYSSHLLAFLETAERNSTGLQGGEWGSLGGGGGAGTYGAGLDAGGGGGPGGVGGVGGQGARALGLRLGVVVVVFVAGLLVVLHAA